MSDPPDFEAPGISLADAVITAGGEIEDEGRYTELFHETDVPPIVAGYLLPHEHQVIATQRHPIVLLPAFAAFFGGLAAAIALNSWAYESGTATLLLVRVIWIAWLIGVAWSVWKWLNWRVTWFVVTSSRLMYITGLIKRDTTPLPLSRLTDCRLQQDLIGGRYGWGTIICESFATDHALHTTTYLPYVQTLFNEIWALRTPVPAVRGPRDPEEPA